MMGSLLDRNGRCGLACELSLLDGSAGLQDGIDPGHLEERTDAFVDTDEDQAAAVTLGGDECVHQYAQTGGIHVGDCGEIDDEALRCKRSNFGLELEYIAQGEGTIELQDGDAGSRSRCDCVGESLVEHTAEYISAIERGLLREDELYCGGWCRGQNGALG